MTPLLGHQFKIQLIDSKAKLPHRMHECDAGLDLYCIDDGTTKIDPKGVITTYRTGLKVEIPTGNVGLIFARSSITETTPFMLGNAVGVVDENYRGEVLLKFRDLSEGYNKNIYKAGDRIGQLLIVPIRYYDPVAVEELSDTDRQEGSFGSTGK